MKKSQKEARVLLYNFIDQNDLAKTCEFFTLHNIKQTIVDKADFNQKVGFLLNLKGFSGANNTGEEDFDFNHKVIIFHNINNKHLDEVLAKMKNADIISLYKAVVTPLNRFWTLKRLCITMQKEHGAMIELQKKREDHE
ncbi:DUF3783 domain-containing protein [Pectinatus frisingensis]|uniref:DUF3783 domain-containing protein n=1 Tax=Pectinatus frisingensis TaxID=865 RepID=UPI0018C5AAA1|nr:DUF3783 domain-containing protein [Pectinatus frisingensis]